MASYPFKIQRTLSYDDTVQRWVQRPLTARELEASLLPDQYRVLEILRREFTNDFERNDILHDVIGRQKKAYQAQISNHKETERRLNSIINFQSNRIRALEEFIQDNVDPELMDMIEVEDGENFIFFNI